MHTYIHTFTHVCRVDFMFLLQYAYTHTCIHTFARCTIDIYCSAIQIHTYMHTYIQSQDADEHTRYLFFRNAKSTFLWSALSTWMYEFKNMGEPCVCVCVYVCVYILQGYFSFWSALSKWMYKFKNMGEPCACVCVYILQGYFSSERFEQVDA